MSELVGSITYFNKVIKSPALIESGLYITRLNDIT